MPRDPTRLCKCHGEPMYASGKVRRCYRKLVVSWKRYHTTEKGQIADRRFEQSDRRRTRLASRIRARRIYGGYAETPEVARAIEAHMRKRVHEFKSGQQARAETESVSAGSVQTETEP